MNSSTMLHIFITLYLGGGVLAHTIVGVCFNDKTGIIK